MAQAQRIRSSALMVVLAVVGLVAAGRWLQPQLDRQTPVTSSTRPPSTARPTVTTTGPPNSPGITRTARTPPVDAIAVTPGSVWVAAGGLVMRVDPRTRRAIVVPGIETVVAPVVRLAAGAGAVWATTTAGRPLLRIEPRTARVAAALPVPAQAVAADRRGVWAVCCDSGAGPGRLVRIHPASGRVVKVIGLRGRPYAVGVGPSGVWVGGAGGLLWRVDPTGNRVVATIRLPSSDPISGTDDADALAGAVAVTDDGVWVNNPAAATVWRIDPRRNQVTEDVFEADGDDLAVAADGLVWATSDTRLLGLGAGPEVRGPRRNLHELGTDRITATAAAGDGGLWLGTSQGLFHVTRGVLLASPDRPGPAG